jgi:hypothetical protein
MNHAIQATTFVCTSSTSGVLPMLSSQKHETLVGGV